MLSKETLIFRYFIIVVQFHDLHLRLWCLGSVFKQAFQIKVEKTLPHQDSTVTDQWAKGALAFEWVAPPWNKFKPGGSSLIFVQSWCGTDKRTDKPKLYYDLIWFLINTQGTPQNQEEVILFEDFECFLIRYMYTPIENIVVKYYASTDNRNIYRVQIKAW